MQSNNYPVGPSNHPGQPGLPPATPVPLAPGLPLTPPPILSGNPTLWSLWAALQRRWRLAVAVSLLGGIMAGVVTWYVSVAYTYTAVAYLRVEEQKPFNVFPVKGGEANAVQRAQVQLIRSHQFLNRLLNENPKVHEIAVAKSPSDPVDWLDKQLQVDFALGPDLMRISMSGPNEDAVRTIVLAVQEAFVKEVKHSE